MAGPDFHVATLNWTKQQVCHRAVRRGGRLVCVFVCVCVCVCARARVCVCVSSGQTLNVAFHPPTYPLITLRPSSLQVSIGIDGVTMSTIDSPCMIVPIAMLFDRETMPGW